MGTIIGINLDGMASKLLMIGQAVIKYDPAAILIQDMPIKCESLLARAAPNFEVIKEDPTRAANSTAILIDTSKVTIVKTHKYNGGEQCRATGASIRVKRNNSNTESKGDMIIFSVYIRPRSVHHEIEACLNWIERTSRENEGLSRCLIEGDFNASNAKWAPTTDILDNTESSDKHYKNLKETRGRYIEQRTNKMKLNCLNDPKLGPTYSTRNTEAYIDLVFVGNKTSRQWHRMEIKELAPKYGHKLILIETCNRNPNRDTKKRHRTIRVVKAELVREEHFIEAKTKSRPLIENWRCLPTNRIIIRLDKLTEILYKGLLEAQDKVTTTRVKRRQRSFEIGQANARTRRHIRKLKSAEQTIAEIKRGPRSITAQQQRRHKRQLKEKLIKTTTKRNQLKTKVVRGINAHELANRIRESDTNDLWEAIRLANQYKPASQQETTVEPQPNSTGTTQADNWGSQEDLDRLAELKFPKVTRRMENFTKNAIQNSEMHWLYVEDKETDIAIRTLRKKRYTSPEGINMQVFYKSIQFIKDIVHTIVSMSFYTAYIPKACHLTQGTLIPKKQPGEFRIVHVSSPMAALLELVALKRLEYRLEVTNLNSAYQFGFCAQRGRHDLMARLLETTMKHKHKLKDAAITTLISVDIKGAFDNVDQDMLIEKMNTEFGREPLKYWLSEFIVNRLIRIKKGNTTSKTRQVCRGVPQGSALGPILWNYAINDIERGMTKPGQTELLKYADDIMIVHHGRRNDHQVGNSAQQCIDKLVARLRVLKLELCPEKSSYMIIQTGNTTNNECKLSIDGKELKQVSSLNILGMNINPKLKLDLKESKLQESIAKATRYLHNIRQLEIINSAKEWSTLIDSHLMSRLIINNWPLLVLDKATSKRVDNMLINSLRTIFDWPKNSSTKIVRLITGKREANTMALRMTQMKCTTELASTYKFLYLMTIPEERSRIKERGAHRANQVFDLSDNPSFAKRKHFNPEKIPTVQRADDLEELMGRVGPIWAILDRKQGSMMIELLLDKVLQKKLGRHAEYPIGYFNSFAMLQQQTKSENIEHKNLVMADNSSILMALENYNNHDWRLIKLRETIYEKKWRIFKIDEPTHKAMNEYINSIYRNLATRVDTTADDFETWLVLMEQSTGGEETREANQENRTIIDSIKEPYLGDYKERNKLNRMNRSQDRAKLMEAHTSLTRIICSKPETWQEITPNWIDGQKMLMLSGLVRTEEGQLARGTNQAATQCSVCRGGQTQQLSESPRWHNLSEEAISRHLTLHRAIHCPRFSTLRSALKDSLRRELETLEMEKTEGLEGYIRHKRLCQRMLRYLSKCAMNVTNT